MWKFETPWAKAARLEEEAVIAKSKAKMESKRTEKLEEDFQRLLEKAQAFADAEQERLNAEQAIVDEEQRLEKLVADEDARKNAAKNLATKNEESYITVTQIDVTEGVQNGNFAFDWNEYFIKELHAGGYVGVSDEQAVEQWFRDVCKYVLAEAYEQSTADLGIPAVEELTDGRKSYS